MISIFHQQENTFSVVDVDARDLMNLEAEVALFVYNLEFTGPEPVKYTV